MRLWVRSLALLSGLRIRRCRELWCRLQTRLRSCVAEALARLAATALIRPLAWEPPYAAGAAQEMAKRQKKKKKPVSATWMELETLILSEVSQKEKDKYHMILLISGI